ncbi:hypothetical protein BU23DRAFT_597680 [Bimuria novae-zelandiae CBS 107.79]|uniref:Uncharacterized protein n=1 Tax=Bimuria novae-zelandiae CBS 107.79 TaxID=1447943 RepID=A0A6A5VQJ7_9PLEO|nr:hypothetical protein BU23DRAFT_597680 [Bimuria novae-zelandiae CBS 107.79]
MRSRRLAFCSATTWAGYILPADNCNTDACVALIIAMAKNLECFRYRMSGRSSIVYRVLAYMTTASSSTLTKLIDVECIGRKDRMWLKSDTWIALPAAAEDLQIEDIKSRSSNIRSRAQTTSQPWMNFQLSWLGQ